MVGVENNVGNVVENQKPVICFLRSKRRLSLLLAHTWMPDCRKSFISTHIVNDPRGGGMRFSKNRLMGEWSNSAKAQETKYISKPTVRQGAALIHTEDSQLHPIAM
jgi:hypothetical protein